MLRAEKLILTFILIIPLFLPYNCQAYELILSSNQTNYQLGDNINVTLDIKNTKKESVEILIDAKLQHMNGQMPPMPITKSISLNPSEETIVELYSINIDEQFFSGIYTVQVNIYENGFHINEEHITLSLAGLPQEMNVTVLISEKQSFSPQSRTFIKNNEIFFNLLTTSENHSYNIVLIYPDNTSKKINFPTSIIAKQPGIYILQGYVTAEGYRNSTFTEYFAVLAKTPFTEQTTIDSMLFIIVALVIVIMLIVVVFSRKKR